MMRSEKSGWRSFLIDEIKEDLRTPGYSKKLTP